MPRSSDIDIGVQGYTKCLSILKKVKVVNGVLENFRTTTGWPNISVKREKRRGGR